ncbi:DUF3231 family protein [Cytobacillus purgationiresistens]|uniref:DUF3231 family protein n=1 Tax=Cytobacillus purgationiresistens TaxID=863449 RepID=A0ABU0ACM3_9BACI|nr:DUF3231 family protein [Cytobacillus purgationiresistens]MDQ0269005.1 hypothetical protein [Cytobacillus purgationiresistens]
MTEMDQRLTSAEMAQLWNAYMNNNMYMCVLKFFKEKTEDNDLCAIIDFAIETCEKLVNEIIGIYEKEDHPIQKSVTVEEDVNLQAPLLYSEVLMLSYIHDMTRYGMIGYSTAVSIAVRSDVLELFTESLHLDIELYKKALKLLQDKGVYYRNPSVPIPEKVEIAKKEGYLSGFIGEQRALTVIEIMNIYNDMQRNALGKALLLGFSQTAASPDVIKFMTKGVRLFNESVEEFTKTLIKENISVSSTWDSEVLNSTTPPFSDKLMMMQVVMYIATISGFYGTALGTSSRRDLGVMYGKLMAEILSLGNEAAKILITNGWLEQAPQSIDHNHIAKLKKK